MGIVRRKYNKERVDLHKKYKRPIMLVLQTMRPNFTDEDFYKEFKRLQPIAWQELQDKYLSYRSLDKARAQKGRWLRKFPSPKRIILMEAKTRLSQMRNIHKQDMFNEKEADALRTSLEKQAQCKIRKSSDRQKRDLYYIQEIAPHYIDRMIQLYYTTRKKDTLDVNSRLLIIQEAAKYKSTKTEIFLKKIQSGDKNENLRMEAYKALLQMHAPDVKLHRKRKGKMKTSQTIKATEIQTPKELLDAIYNAEIERMKEFDIFISHSSQNREAIHDLIKEFNHSRFVCYVDWVEDRQQLKRTLTSKETAEVITNRIKQSRYFIYVLTKECISSKWSPWELGYAYAIGKPIFIYKMEDVEDLPEYFYLHQLFDDIQELVTSISNYK